MNKVVPLPLGAVGLLGQLASEKKSHHAAKMINLQAKLISCSLIFPDIEE